MTKLSQSLGISRVNAEAIINWMGSNLEGVDAEADLRKINYHHFENDLEVLWCTYLYARVFDRAVSEFATTSFDLHPHEVFRRMLFGVLDEIRKP